MDRINIQRMFEDVTAGKCTLQQFMERLRILPFQDLAFGKIDHHRSLRNAFSEVIFCEGKTLEQIERLVQEHVDEARSIFCTRLSQGGGERLARLHPDGDFDVISRTFQCRARSPVALKGTIAILCAGTADLPVAEEARRTAEFFGAETARYYDVGVAGLPRLLGVVEEVRAASIAIVVAGMEGALPSVVAGLIPLPIIACPTSVGYGVHLQGLTALFSMLGSCAEGVSVVNIDNGFGAACAALRMLRKSCSLAL